MRYLRDFKSEPCEPAARSRSYSLRSPNRELRAAGSPGSASVVMRSKTLATLNNHPALGEAGARTARFGERSEYEGSRTAAVAWCSKTLAALNNHPALGEAGARTARFGERSEYEVGRNAAVAWRSKTLAALIDHSALGEAGVRTARFGERSEYEGSRTPASPSAFLKENRIHAEPNGACSD